MTNLGHSYISTSVDPYTGQQKATPVADPQEVDAEVIFELFRFTKLVRSNEYSKKRT